jgi:hypothetical protein
MPSRFPAFVIMLVATLAATRAHATVTITNCAVDPNCVARGLKTIVDVPDDTVVVAGPLVPLPDTTTIQIHAKEIAVDGASGGGISATGKGMSILLDAPSILVTGTLQSANTNGKILLRGADTVQVQPPADLDSGGDVRITCTGGGCTLSVVGAHIHANHLVLDAQGDIVWDANTVSTFSPRDLIDIESHKGSIRKSGAPGTMTVALARGRLVAEVVDEKKVDAVSEAVGFCQSCQQVTPTPAATPTQPGSTASLPISTPTPTDPTPTRTPTPAPGTPTPIPTSSPCSGCNHIKGEQESTLMIQAAVDVDVSGDQYAVAEGISIAAGGNVNLTNTELRNDFGKCGEIVVTSGGQINIQGAVLVDDDCRNKTDVSSLNGREELPHTGFNDVVGFPAIDD